MDKFWMSINNRGSVVILGEHDRSQVVQAKESVLLRATVKQ